MADMSVDEADLCAQYGGSPIKVGEDEYSLFRDHEYVVSAFYSLARILT